MSRIGKLPISLPKGVEITVNDNNIITYNSDYFDSIGNISLLKILQKDNIDNKEIFYLTEEIITSMDIINKLATTNDRDELVKIIISYIDGEDTPINRMINDIIDIKSKIRHTSDGFPCLVFIKFAPDKNGNARQPKFFGIYISKMQR